MSGGYYYSYIVKQHSKSVDVHRNCWNKFDDGDVTECKMDDDKGMKNQCFGGEYMGDVFDHMTKCMSYRCQNHVWNAYILFYERMDAVRRDGAGAKASPSQDALGHRVWCAQAECAVHA